MKKKRTVNIIIGIALFFLCGICLPSGLFTNAGAKYSVGLIVLMAYWWITAPVDLAVTALLPIPVNALLCVVDSSAVLSQYANETVMLIFGASLVSASWDETGLNSRIAYTFIGFAGNSLRRQVIFWFLLSAAMSTVLANIAVAAALTPVAISMLDKRENVKEVGRESEGSWLLMAVAWGAGIGGLATPLGGAMNLVVVNFLEQVSGTEYVYVNWIVRFLPVMLVLIVSNVVFLWLAVPGNLTVGSRAASLKEHTSEEKMSGAELAELIIFVVAVVLSFLRPLFSGLLPGIKPAYIFVAAGILSFFVSGKDGNPVSTWNNAEQKINWGILYIIAGGLAAAKMLTGSGADVMLGSLINASGISGGFGFVFIFLTGALILSDITSNTATAGVVIPIVLAATKTVGLNPIPFIYAVTVGVNISYTLPTSTRAIPVGYGMPVKFMMKHGALLSLVVIILLVPLCYLLMLYWPAFSTT